MLEERNLNAPVFIPAIFFEHGWRVRSKLGPDFGHQGDQNNPE